ncbi:hypothetical protein MARGE09_P0666 [Marinagarivorans cellulosilyticus]|uniref:Uncharacterized protein n=2 Tax=Marinagarivorans cellulosilyticus TaxID=2721545 RepID=A0AAN2BJ21_9GAMM|nr:hypothetical protein MARGE09_P0666 [Marinagarivorans cellulosilyticus]
MILRQTYLAIATMAIVLLVTFSIMKYVDKVFMETWLALIFIVCVPFQVAASSILDSYAKDKPRAFNIPLKRLAAIAIYSLMAIAAGVISYLTVGGADSMPKPPLINYAIVTVVVTFWYVIVWGCWPISKLSSHPAVISLSTIIVAFFVGYLVYSLLFSFEFMASSPFYVESLDPKGALNSWNALAFLVTSVAVIFTLVMLDFWPLSKFSIAARPMASGIIKSAIILISTGVIYHSFINLLGVDPVIYLVNGPISYIFGVFIPLNLFCGKLFSNVLQPLKGFFLIVVSAGSGFLLNLLYFSLSGELIPAHLEGELYQRELWVANAMLAFSFPLLVILTDHLKFWPINFKQGDREIK